MADAGLILVCSLISPFSADRRMVAELVGRNAFFEIFVDTPLEDCIARDPKGLYAKAKRGEIENFTGFDPPYEPPSAQDLHVRTVGHAPRALADRVVELLRARGIIRSRNRAGGPRSHVAGSLFVG